MAFQQWVDETNGSDVTGDGSQGNPWSTLAKAIEERGASPNINEIFVVGPLTLSASLDLTNNGPGAPTSTSPVRFFFDGSQCTFSNQMFSPWPKYVLVDGANINYTGPGNTYCIRVSSWSQVHNCRITGTAIDQQAIYVGQYGTSINNHVSGFGIAGSHIMYASSQGKILGNVMEGMLTGGAYCIGSTTGTMMAYNYVLIDVTSGSNIYIGLRCSGNGMLLHDNVVLCTDTGLDTRGIYNASGRHSQYWMNNYVEGCRYNFDMYNSRFIQFRNNVAFNASTSNFYRESSTYTVPSDQKIVAADSWLQGRGVNERRMRSIFSRRPDYHRLVERGNLLRSIV